MPKCAVKNCKNHTSRSKKNDGISYFRFPRNIIGMEEWRRVIAKARGEEYYKPSRSSIICSEHFVESDMYETATGMRRIKKGGIPKIKVDHPEPTAGTSTEKEIKTEPETETYVVEYSENDEFDVLKEEPEAPLSPASSGNCSILDSPSTVYYKKTIKNYQEKLDMKNKQIQALKKKVQRLSKSKLKLKEMVKELKKISRTATDNSMESEDESSESDNQETSKTKEDKTKKKDMIKIA